MRAKKTTWKVIRTGFDIFISNTDSPIATAAPTIKRITYVIIAYLY
ncbi:MAG: hypothetical protein MI922_19585 [Bacteroidales bacterium]|nr:hypothetical protein [Bacteroidales bacterium]